MPAAIGIPRAQSTPTHKHNSTNSKQPIQTQLPTNPTALKPHPPHPPPLTNPPSLPTPFKTHPTGHSTTTSARPTALNRYQPATTAQTMPTHCTVRTSAFLDTLIRMSGGCCCLSSASAPALSAVVDAGGGGGGAVALALAAATAAAQAAWRAARAERVVVAVLGGSEGAVEDGFVAGVVVVLAVCLDVVVLEVLAGPAAAGFVEGLGIVVLVVVVGVFGGTAGGLASFFFSVLLLLLLVFGFDFDSAFDGFVSLREVLGLSVACFAGDACVLVF